MKKIDWSDLEKSHGIVEKAKKDSKIKKEGGFPTIPSPGPLTPPPGGLTGQAGLGITKSESKVDWSEFEKTELEKINAQVYGTTHSKQLAHMPSSQAKEAKARMGTSEMGMEVRRGNKGMARSAAKRSIEDSHQPWSAKPKLPK